MINPSSRKTSKTQNFPKTPPNPLGFGTEGKVVGRVDFYQEIFFLKSENYFKPDFSRAEVGNFSAPAKRAKKPASKLFSDFGKKTLTTK
jgi:hypothetical protein